jgi:hypothetical protein
LCCIQRITHRNRLVSVQEYDDQDALLKQVDHTYDAFNRWIGKQVDDDGDQTFERTKRDMTQC